MKITRIPVDSAYRADLKALRSAISGKTAVIVGSAPTFPHGAIDPIAEMAEMARQRGAGMHVDACLGGFILPWVEKLGYPVPPFDFRVPGVTSMSADTHKYGFAAKDTSVVLYRDKTLRRYQYFTVTDWPGGLYLSPGLAGSRSGGLIAAAWAAMISTGAEKYLQYADEIYQTAQTIRAGVASIPEFEVIGDPTFLVAFKAADGPEPIDVYLVNDALKDAGWRLNALQLPPALHFCVTRPNTRPGVADDFLLELRAAVDHARRHRGTPAKSGAMYGFGGTPEGNATVNQIMSGVLDIMHEAAPQSPGT